MPELHAEAVVRDSVAIIAAALLPTSVLAAPRLRARLRETAMHLPNMLRNAAMVDAAMRGVVGPDAAMIGGAVGLLLSRRRVRSVLLMFLSPGR